MGATSERPWNNIGAILEKEKDIVFALAHANLFLHVFCGSASRMSRAKRTWVLFFNKYRHELRFRQSALGNIAETPFTVPLGLLVDRFW